VLLERVREAAVSSLAGNFAIPGICALPAGPKSVTKYLIGGYCSRHEP